MRIKTNIGVITERIKAKLSILNDHEYLLRPVCFDVIELMTNRIHMEGKDSDGNAIGTYSKGYMAIRTGVFQNSERFKKGAQKGKVKNAGKFTDRTIRLNKQTGVFTGEDKVGTERPNYHRSSDPKVIISLTRQLENDWSVIATNAGYGIGFKNPFNLQKARWAEATYKKDIFKTTIAEREYAIKKIQGLIKQAFQ